MFIPIFNNISLLVTLSVAYVFLIRYLDQSKKTVQVFSGVLFGFFIILAIANAVEIEPGLIFDGRSIVLSVAGVFAGPIAAVIAALMAAWFRIQVGGPGMWMGLLVIVQATLVGIWFHYLVKNKKLFVKVALYFIMGLLVHLIMLIMTLALPGNLRWEVFSVIALPVLVIYPLGSFLVCMLFHYQKKYLKLVSEVTEGDIRFRQLFFDSHMVFLVIDPDSGNIVQANKAAERYYGYSLDQIRKMKITQINTLNDKDIRLRISLAFEDMQSRFTMKHRLASVEVRDVEVFAGPVNYAGKTHLYSIVSDITERLKTEKRLTESEKSYHGLFDSISDAIYIQDREGFFIDVNKGAEKMYGYAREDYIGKTPDFLSAEGRNDITQLKKNIELAFQGVESGFEFWGMKKNGEIFPKYVRLFKGEYFGQEVAIAVGHDITNRKLVQQELEESRFNLNTLINVSDDVLLLLDSKGVILLHNNAFANYYANKKNMAGDNLFSLLSGSVAEERRKYFSNVLETGKPISFEENSFEKDWWITYYPIPGKDAKVERVAVYARDITGQKKLFALQRNLQVAEKSAMIKQQFLSNMSHEMRTPMNGIVGMAEMLAQTNLDEQQQDYLTTIKDSSHTLLSLINDILDLARFESGNMPINLEPMDVLGLKEKIMSLFRHSAQGKGLAFDVAFSDQLPATFVTDEKRLLQVLINLIGNALKFTQSGKVTVKASLDLKKRNYKIVRFTVKDTGIGIDNDFLPRIFDEFAQLDNSKTRKYEGSGLGLAISKKIVNLLGGEIGVESEKGKGSAFWFTIKVSDSDQPAAVSKTGGRKEFAPLYMNVLMVEDKIINRKVASLILKNLGCTVDMAENGLQGVEKVSKNLYDVVLMDIQMPVMDGVTAVKAIRKLKQKQPWIIGLSAEAMKGDAERYIEQGMDDYLTKPIVPEILYEKLLGAKERQSTS